MYAAESRQPICTGRFFNFWWSKLHSNIFPGHLQNTSRYKKPLPRCFREAKEGCVKRFMQST